MERLVLPQGPTDQSDAAFLRRTLSGGRNQQHFPRHTGFIGLRELGFGSPGKFRFVLKAPQRITHIKRLRGVARPVAQFLEAAETFKRRLGPLLFQLPPNFQKDLSRLANFLALLPRRFRVALEFRHPSWFDEGVFALLRKRRAALCIADTEDGPAVPFIATAEWGYLRLRRENYGNRTLMSWAKRIRGAGWRDTFVFFRHEDEGKGPRFAKRLDELAA